MKPKPLALVAVFALVATACGSSTSTTGPTVVKIGVELPLSGGEAPNGGPTLNGIKLAIQQIAVPATRFSSTLRTTP